MKIERFQYYDKTLDWKIENVSFSDLTLFVGISGAGKTQILQSLLTIKQIAEGKSFNGVKWEIVFSTTDGHPYSWSGEFESNPYFALKEYDLTNQEESTDDIPKVLSESLYQDGIQIIERKEKEIFLNGTKTPKLSPSVSVLSLLKHEDVIHPVHRDFRKIVNSNQFNQQQRLLTTLELFLFRHMSDEFDTIEKVQESDLGTTIKLAIIYKSHPNTFKQIQDRFREIFPQVTDIKVEPLEDRNDSSYIEKAPIVQIKERGISNWIPQHKISSGMLRTLFHIAEMYLWPKGTVILIDEFENSLGVNCIDILTEDLLQQNRNLQFILTSHHPYIINNISPIYWKVVRRKGGTVTAEDFDSLGLSDSSHEAFIQLINSDAYREGIVTA